MLNYIIHFNILIISKKFIRLSYRNKIFSLYLHGLLDWLSGDDTGSLDTDTLPGLVAERSCSVDGVSKGVDDTTQKLQTDGDVDDGAGTLDDIAFLDQLIVTCLWKKQLKLYLLLLLKMKHVLFYHGAPMKR